MYRGVALPVALLALLATEGVCSAQPQSWCVPGTQVCAQGDGKGGVKVGGSAQGQADPSGASGSANGNANADAGASGSSGRQGQGTYVPPRYSRPTRFGTGATFCGTVKAGVHSGVKAGGCFAVSFRWEPLFFEMETQLLFGGQPRSIDWLFPLSFVVPLTSDRSLYEGLQLRAGGTPVGVTFASSESRRNYVRFGLHAGLSYEWDFSDAASWRVFDARAFLDFGTKDIDDRGHSVDYGGQLATGMVF